MLYTHSGNAKSEFLLQPVPQGNGVRTVVTIVLASTELSATLSQENVLVHQDGTVIFLNFPCKVQGAPKISSKQQLRHAKDVLKKVQMDPKCNEEVPKTDPKCTRWTVNEGSLF